MAYRTSSVWKMVVDAPEKRRILQFPRPHILQATPYLQIEFSEITKRVALENRPVISNLRICKVILLGDVCVGKTCIVNRFCHQVFDKNYKATIGVDFDVEKFEILQMPFTLQIWDTAGQERFKSIAQSYYRRAHVIVLVFDVTNISSLRSCQTWLKEALDVNDCEPFIFLVGTKTDLMSSASYKVVENFACKVAKNLNAEYWCCSSKTNENIEELFARIAALSFDSYIKREYESDNNSVNIGSINLKTNKNAKDRRKRETKCNGFNKCQ